MRIKNYVKPTSIEKAYELLNASPKNKLLAGCTFLRMTNVYIPTAIDITQLELNYIKQNQSMIHIGATTPLYDIECSPLINDAFGSVLKDILVHLIGVQLRNSITIGAHVYRKYGFSDIIPLLIALDASVVLHKNGTIKLADFMDMPIKKDILVEIQIPVKDQSVAAYSMRSTYSDYPILTMAVARSAGNWNIVVGARPGKAKFASKAMGYLNSKSYEQGDNIIGAKLAAREMVFGTNTRATAGYRQAICNNVLAGLIEEVAMC